MIWYRLVVCIGEGFKFESIWFMIRYNYKSPSNLFLVYHNHNNHDYTVKLQ